MKETHASTEDHEEPERYEIRLKGYLDERWAARFESLNFTHESDGTTILCGPVVDQAELHGLLRKVRDLGMTLISVIRVESCQAEVIDPFKLTKKGKEKDCESRESKFRGDFYESN